MINDSDGESGKSIKSVGTAFAIIGVLMKDNDPTLSTIANELDLSKSTIHYYLKTLEQNQYIVKRDGKYQIGLRFLTIGGHALIQHKLYQKLDRGAVQRYVEELSDQTGESAVLALEEGGKGIFVYQAHLNNAFDEGVHTGEEFYLHSTAVGKAILASLPRQRVLEYIERHGLPQVTGRTLQTESDLIDELHAIQDRNIAFEDEEYTLGQRGIATSIVDERDGTVLGAVGLIGPVNHFERPTPRIKARRFAHGKADLLMQTSRLIENKILLG